MIGLQTARPTIHPFECSASSAPAGVQIKCNEDGTRRCERDYVVNVNVFR